MAITTSAIVSLREAGRLLDENPTYLKGVAKGLGIEIQMVGRTMGLRQKDLDRLRRKLARTREDEPHAMSAPSI